MAYLAFIHNFLKFYSLIITKKLRLQALKYYKT